MIICGDALAELRKLPDESVNMCVTSPPYWGLRDYGVPGQLGLEKTPEEYVAKMVEIFREVKRVLRKDGTLWLNLGDSYAGSGKGGNPEGSEWAGFVGNKDREKSAQASKPIIPAGLKPKDLVGIPWRVAFALQADGWWLRQDIIWAKPNPMPESVTDRCTKAHEYLFMFAKNGKTILWRAKDTLEWSYRPDLSEILGYDERGKPIKRWRGFSYYYDAEAVKETSSAEWNAAESWGARMNETAPELSQMTETDKGLMRTRGFGTYHSDAARNTRNLRSVWTIATKPFPEAHFATFPPEIPERCIKAGCPKDGVVLDPFFGAGTTGLVAMKLGRDFIGIELNQSYCDMAQKRIYGELIK